MDPNATPSSYHAGSIDPAYFGQPSAEGQSPTVSVGDWVVTIILSAIPFVNIIMLFVWAFSSSTPRSKANWAKATLIFIAIFAVLGFLFAGSIMAVLMRNGGAGHNAY